MSESYQELQRRISTRYVRNASHHWPNLHDGAGCRQCDYVRYWREGRWVYYSTELGCTTKDEPPCDTRIEANSR